jgi:phosphatidylglycerol:prolipoprotein diacylglycerol transferase
MHPILFRIGQFEIYSYGVFMALAFCASLYVLMKQARGTGPKIDPSTVSDIVFLIILSGILGGKLAYVMLNLPAYIQTPFDASLWRGGFVFHGGFFLALAAVFIYAKKRNTSFVAIADLLIPYTALAQAIGRIGCFLNGCCYGRPTNLPIGRVFGLNSPAGYHYGALPLHPTQLYSSLFLFILFLFLKKVRSNRKFEGETLLFYLILYPAFRFSMDFLRGDNLGKTFYGLTLFQFVCVLIVTVSLSILIIKGRKIDSFFIQD